jgi:hypothetical protein
MIRGMVSVLSLSLIFNTKINFLIEHPIKDHFIYDSFEKGDNNYYLDFIWWFDFDKSLEEFLEELFNNKVNLIDKNIIISSNRSFFDLIKKYGNYKRLYTFAYKNIFNYFKPKEYLYSKDDIKYNIIHMRFGDAFLKEAIYCKEDFRNGTLEDIKKNLLLAYDNYKDDGIIKIFSDNIDLLKTLDLENKFIIDTKPSIHFGYETTRNIDIIPTLQTFFEFKNCNKIIVNSYSGFSFLASLCFDKSYLNFNKEQTSFKISKL